MNIFLVILVSLTLACTVIGKKKSRREQKCGDSDELACKTAEEEESIPKKNGILGFCMISSIFWINGLILLSGGYRNINDAKKIADQGNKTIATITDVHEYEVYDGDGEYSDKRDVYVTYIADGQKYDGVIKEANIYDSVGEQIDIYYSSEDPTAIVSPDDVKSKVSFQIPMGVIMVALPFLMVIGSKIVSGIKNSL